MEKLYIIFEVRGQEIKRVDSYQLYSKSRNFVCAKFLFDKHWANVTRFASIANSETTYTVEIVNGECLVPWECLAEAGTFTVSVFGGDLITANKVTVTVLESGLAEGELPDEPTPGYFQQIVDEVKASETNAKNSEDNAENYKDLAETAKNEARKWSDGTGATEDDPQFDNHSKYHAEESKAWAIGTADPEKEQHNNSAKDHAMAAKTSEDNAKISELNAGDYQRIAARVLADVLAILGTPGGLATLDTNGKLTASQIPNITLNDMVDVASVAEMLALTTDDVQNGDVCRIVEDGTITAVYYLADDQHIDNINSWRELKAGYAAQSGYASTAGTASDADRVNGHRHIDMTDEQYDAAQQAGTIVPTDFYYIYSE